jgi:hypothetical protein
MSHSLEPRLSNRSDVLSRFEHTKPFSPFLLGNTKLLRRLTPLMIKPQPRHLRSLIDLQAAEGGGIIVFLDYEEDKREPRRKAKKRDVALKGPV